MSVQNSVEVSGLQPRSPGDTVGRLSWHKCMQRGLRLWFESCEYFKCDCIHYLYVCAHILIIFWWQCLCRYLTYLVSFIVKLLYTRLPKQSQTKNFPVNTKQTKDVKLLFKGCYYIVQMGFVSRRHCSKGCCSKVHCSFLEQCIFGKVSLTIPVKRLSRLYQTKDCLD